MIEIELETPEEFYDLNLESDDQILCKLKEDYPETYDETICEIKNLHALIGVKCSNIYDLVSESELIDAIDDNISEEILLNYFVKDSCGTDKGTQYMTLENGYRFIKEDN